MIEAVEFLAGKRTDSGRKLSVETGLTRPLIVLLVMAFAIVSIEFSGGIDGAGIAASTRLLTVDTIESGPVDLALGYAVTGNALDESALAENALVGNALSKQSERTLIRLYVAYFGRDPDVAGLEYWRARMYRGVEPQTISSAFAASREFQDRYGHLSNGQFVDLVYRNVMDREADVDGHQYWEATLNSGVTRGELMLAFSESPEFIDKTADRATPTGLREFTAEDARGQQALDRISYPWEQQLPGWTIDFAPGRRGVYGLTYTGERRIVIYVRSSQSNDHLAHVTAHEIGHAVDVTFNDGDDRRRWLAQRGIKGVDWWPTKSGAIDTATGAGDFAESFADWQLSTGIFNSKLAGRPDAGDRALLGELAYG